jgi:Flp pilus assembly protein TadD
MDVDLGSAIAAFQSGELDRSRQLAEAQLELRASPQLYHLIGLIDCREGKIEDGIEWLRRAFDADPGNTNYRLMLVRALIDVGRAAEALELAVRPSGTGPSDIALWHARAEAADAAGDAHAAVEACQIECAADSGDWRTWTNLGRNLFKLERVADSEHAYRKAMASAPEEAAPVLELGLIYDRINRRQQLADLLDSASRQGIARDGLAELWAIRAYHEGRPDDARKLLARSTGQADVMRWQRLRAKFADSAGESVEAFNAATQMNRAAPDFEKWRAQAAKYRQELRHTTELLTAGWVAALPRSPVNIDRALAFLIGFPRSGTTLLDTFLMGHTQVEVVEERGLLVAAGRSIGPIDSLPQCSSEQLERSRAIYLQMLERHTDSNNSGLIVDKAPLNMLAAPLIHCLFGPTPIIFTQRHPCDAVLSGFMQSFAANLGMASFLDIGDAADFYDAAMGMWMASTEALPLKTFTVVYEDLVGQPEHVLRPLVEFLGLRWDHRVLNHQATAKARGPIQNPSYDQVPVELNDRGIGRWRRYEEQLKPVLPVLMPWAERLGYRD